MYHENQWPPSGHRLATVWPPYGHRAAIVQAHTQATAAGAGTFVGWIFAIDLINFLLGGVLNATLDLPTRLSYILEASRPFNTPQHNARKKQ